MPVWEDATSYSQGERALRAPDAWRLALSPSLKILIVRKHSFNLGEWLVTCHALQIDAARLGLSSEVHASFAQEKAIALVLSKLKNMMALVEKFSEQTPPV